ncbi:MAG: hypothetical protein V7784_07905 [Oceanospirillaceae bacterium]
MSESSNGSTPEGSLMTLVSNNIPALQAGHYTISSTLTGIKNVPDTLDEVSVDLYAARLRLFLAPNEINTVFPPANSNGDFNNVLPHIEFNRSTLPWERSTGSSDKKLPWFALILMEEDELADTEKVIEVFRKPGSEETSKDVNKTLRSAFSLDSEFDDGPRSDHVKMDNCNVVLEPFPQVLVINFNSKYLNSILPNEENLKLLCQLKFGTDQQGEKYERAIMACNRMPLAGRKAQVHLVSLEQYQGSRKALFSEKSVELLSLYNWSFCCLNEDGYHLSGINL